MVNFKDLGRKQSCNNLKYYTVMCLQELRWGGVSRLRFVFLFQTQSWNAAHSCMFLEYVQWLTVNIFNPLNAELNPICYLLALLGAHHFLRVSRIRVKSLTLRLLMLYIYMEHLFLMFLDHTRRRTTVGRTPLDE